MEMRLSLVHLTSFELHGNVADTEELHRVVDVLENVLVAFPRPHVRDRAR